MSNGPTGRLQGRRILVTGASRGIGLEVVRRFYGEGAEILGVARDESRLTKAMQGVDPSGRRVSWRAVDLVDPGAPKQLVAAVEARWGALDILFNNAGIQIDAGAQGFVDGTEAVLTSSLDVNLLSPYRLCLALLPHLKNGREPRIVNVSSGAGTLAAMKERYIASYRLSKWALNGFSLLLSAELAGQVAVNAFDPGWVKTDLGGPNAPGEVQESGEAALSLVTLPFDETGKFWKNGEEIPF